MHDKLGMEAIRTLHQQLDDDENGNIDLSESDDVSDKQNYNFKVFSDRSETIINCNNILFGLFFTMNLMRMLAII